LQHPVVIIRNRKNKPLQEIKSKQKSGRDTAVGDGRERAKLDKRATSSGDKSN
jgi:hypothetical protein